MHCHLLVPGLLPPRSLREEIGPPLRLPALETLLARGQRNLPPAIGIGGWLCRAFAVEKQQDWPIAPITLLADGVDPGGAYWLRADPVHLRVSRDRLILADHRIFSIFPAEAEALVATLNQHFSAETWRFFAPCAERWYVRLDQPAALETAALPQAAGGYVDEHLPRGKDAPRWRSVVNEIQMLFHAHPVNLAREARGEPAVNSIWLWAGGGLAAIPRSPFATVLGDEVLTRAFATASGMQCRPLPGNADEWLQAGVAAGECLVMLDGLDTTAQYQDAGGWLEAVQALEQRWFAPLKQALLRGKVKKITLHAPGTHGALEVCTDRKDMGKFWKRRKPLSAYWHY